MVTSVVLCVPKLKSGSGPGGYLLVHGGYLMVSGGYLMVDGGYLMFPGSYLNKGVLLSSLW